MSTLAKCACRLTIGILMVLGPHRLTAKDPPPPPRPVDSNAPYQPADYRLGLIRKLNAAEQKHATVIAGNPNPKSPTPWLFFTAELRSALSPPFWGTQAVGASRSSNPKFADPLPPILDFHQQLKAAGIELWIVPVPAKVAVYPQHCDYGGLVWINQKRRVDQSHQRFYELLRKEGITVVDLTDDFRSPITDAKQLPRFCLTDSHWSGPGVQVAANVLATKIKTLTWYQALPKAQFHTESMTVEITGDLAVLLDEKNPVKETLNLTRVMQTQDGKSVPIADDPQSRVLLLGDSHTLVFHDPTLYAEGCGLADHLSEQTGMSVDVIGVRGSGANAARLNWRRRPDPLTGKKLVIWCFSMREFTENTDGWRVIPIVKPKGD